MNLNDSGIVWALMSGFAGPPIQKAKDRLFIDHRIWTEIFEDWLSRTGSGKMHNITKKIPTQVFAVEA